MPSYLHESPCCLRKEEEGGKEEAKKEEEEDGNGRGTPLKTLPRTKRKEEFLPRVQCAVYVRYENKKGKRKREEKGIVNFYEISFVHSTFRRLDLSRLCTGKKVSCRRVDRLAASSRTRPARAVQCNRPRAGEHGVPVTLCERSPCAYYNVPYYRGNSLTSRHATQRAKLGPYRAKKARYPELDNMSLLKIPPVARTTWHQ